MKLKDVLVFILLSPLIFFALSAVFGIGMLFLEIIWAILSFIWPALVFFAFYGLIVLLFPKIGSDNMGDRGRPGDMN